MKRPLPVASAYAPWSDAALFEVSWEVCNQVGGIYQVLRSKERTMVERWGDRYLVVGPYVPDMAGVEFEVEHPADFVGPVLARLAAEGHTVHCGRWLVDGRPRALLVEARLDGAARSALERRLTRELGIDPRSHDPLVQDVLGFGEAVRRLLQAFAGSERAGPGDAGGTPPRLLAHFHEWVGGLGLPLLSVEKAPIATVFTTHATSVGRYLSGSESRLYERLVGLDGDGEAKRFGIDAQHQIERTCARRADVFTTVSPLTAEECDAVLGRKPELVTPNGLDIDRFDVGHDFQNLHAQYKEQIHRAVMGHFFPSYAFDLDRTLYFFSAGRFEPRNKGFDLCLEAMARLNHELKAADLGLTVVFFVVTARSTRSLDPHALHTRGILDELREVSHRIGRDVAERLFRRSAAGESPSLDSLVDEYWRLRHRRVLHAFRTHGLPPVTTHVLDDPEHDPILAHLRHLRLSNAPGDPVKVVYHPEFISSVSPLWGMDYDQFVRGCHLGVFPSSYEPWGYTPLECVAMGVPAVTSDLAGFGRYVADAYPDHDDWGLVVLPRRGRSFQDAAADLTARLLRFCRADRRARISLRNEVEAHSRAFDWSRLASAYHEAHDLALAGGTRAAK
jgi:glycogen(starch) synthase